MFMHLNLKLRQRNYVFIFLGIFLITSYISTSLMAGVVKLTLDAGAGNPKRLVIEYHQDHEFENSISSSSLKGCLPNYGSVQEIKNFKYAVRVVSNVYKKCGENITTKNLIKYGLLGGVIATSAAVSAVTAVPAPPVAIVAGSVTAAFTPYVLGELQSDTAKCVLKAFIESSDVNSSKKAGNQLIDTFFLLKDWSSYFESMGKVVPELMVGKGLKDFKSIAEFISATPERTGENLDRVNIVQNTANSINNLFIGSTRIAINKTNDAFLDCSIKKARDFRELSIKAAKLECRTYGMQYRMMEDSIEKAISKNYRHFSNITGRIPADNELDLLNTKQINAYNGLLRFSKVFKELELLKDKINERSKNLVSISMNYSRQLQSLKSKTTTTAICKGFGSLDEYLKPFNDECKKAILSVFSLEEDTKQLLEHINNTARQLSSSHWSDLNKISASLSSCLDINKTEKRLLKLQSAFEKNPIYMYMDSECKLVDQYSFNKKFNALKKYFEKKKSECENKNSNSKIPIPSHDTQCPKQNPGDKESYKFDTNNNPKDRTYLICHYYKGKLSDQKPYRNGKLDGVVFNMRLHPIYSETTSIFKNGKLHGLSETWWKATNNNYNPFSQIINKTSGIEKPESEFLFKYSEGKYINGKIIETITYNQKGEIMKKTTYHGECNLYQCEHTTREYRKGKLINCFFHNGSLSKNCNK